MTRRPSPLARVLVMAVVLAAGTISPSCAPAKKPPVEAVAGVLGQDVTSLAGTDGKLLKAEPWTCGPPFTDLLDVHRIHYLSDGLRVVGFMLKPKDMGGPLPAIIYNRGGKGEAGVIDDEWLPVMGTYAYKGYVVIASQYRGNGGGEGKEEFGGSDVNDVLNLIPLAQSLPFVARDKIGMLGVSRGAMMTYIAVTRTDKIKAAAVYGGLVDVVQWYNEREDVRKSLVEVIGGTPTEKREAYELRSATYWPEKINTPLLILHGDADQNVSVSQPVALAEKLKALGKTYELVIYPQGSHGLFESWRDRDQKILKWFETYLR